MATSHCAAGRPADGLDQSPGSRRFSGADIPQACHRTFEHTQQITGRFHPDAPHRRNTPLEPPDVMFFPQLKWTGFRGWTAGSRT